METIEKRLEYFIQSKSYNHSRFADRIGVQRSSVSHILTGRNKPSYDFLKKIFDGFPELNADWLIVGRGKMLHSDEDATPGELNTNLPTDSGFESWQDHESDERTKNQAFSATTETQPKTQIKSILVLFVDDSFEEYHSRKP